MRLSTVPTPGRVGTVPTLGPQPLGRSLRREVIDEVPGAIENDGLITRCLNWCHDDGTNSSRIPCDDCYPLLYCHSFSPNGASRPTWGWNAAQVTRSIS